MSKRLYLGRLPADARSEDVTKMFDGYGRVIDCRVMTGFGFVEFEHPKDAEDAVNQFNGKDFMGVPIVVEFAKEGRARREPFEDRGDRRQNSSPRSRRPPGHRLIVSGISRDTSWQDLKDFGREAGQVSFADIDRDTPGQGILEYLNRDDAERAVKDLDGKDLRGRPVRVMEDDSRGADNYRRGDRRDDRPRDRYRDERDDRGPRRDRSRSPARRDYDDRDRRPRSPPHRRDDDRRPAGDAPPAERRRDDRRDDRRADKDGFDDRSRGEANGDGGWSR